MAVALFSSRLHWYSRHGSAGPGLADVEDSVWFDYLTLGRSQELPVPQGIRYLGTLPRLLVPWVP